MPRDELYIEKKNAFGHELYGDSLYVPKKEKLQRDFTLFNQDEIVNLIADDSIFEKLKNDSIFRNCGSKHYLTFDVIYEGVGTEVIIRNCPYFLVEDKFNIVDWTSRNEVQAFACIPFDLMGFEKHGDFKMINKININNLSDPSVCHQISARFRTDVAITKNRNHYRFDSANCFIHNDEWFIVKMRVPMKYLQDKQ